MTFVTAEAEFGGKLAGLRRRNIGESSVAGEEECESAELQDASTSERREQQERDLRDPRIVLAAVLRGVQREAELRGGDKAERGGGRSASRCRRLPPYRAAGDGYAGSHGACDLA